MPPLLFDIHIMKKLISMKMKAKKRMKKTSTGKRQEREEWTKKEKEKSIFHFHRAAAAKLLHNRRRRVFCVLILTPNKNNNDSIIERANRWSEESPSLMNELSHASAKKGGKSKWRSINNVDYNVVNECWQCGTCGTTSGVRTTPREQYNEVILRWVNETITTADGGRWWWSRRVAWAVKHSERDGKCQTKQEKLYRKNHREGRRNREQKLWYKQSCEHNNNVAGLNWGQARAQKPIESLRCVSKRPLAESENWRGTMKAASSAKY